MDGRCSSRALASHSMQGGVFSAHPCARACCASLKRVQTTFSFLAPCICSDRTVFINCSYIRHVYSSRRYYSYYEAAQTAAYCNTKQQTCSRSRPQVSSQPAQSIGIAECRRTVSRCCSLRRSTTLRASTNRVSLAQSAVAARLSATRASASTPERVLKRRSAERPANAPPPPLSAQPAAARLPRPEEDLPALVNLCARTPCSGCHAPSAPPAWLGA